jgi:hypothetical protein
MITDRPGRKESVRGGVPTGVTPDLDDWLPSPALRVLHHRESSARPTELWTAAGALRLDDTPVLGRLVRWRIPGLKRGLTFAEMLHTPPFTVLDETEHALVSGLVGRIWTLRRDYPRLRDADAFRHWDQRGTARVAIAVWADDGALCCEARVHAIGVQGGIGLAAVRPLVRGFEHLIGTEALGTAVRRAERGSGG